MIPALSFVILQADEYRVIDGDSLIIDVRDWPAPFRKEAKLWTVYRWPLSYIARAALKMTPE